MYFVFVVFLFFKQKTAYEMRISDWSSDVCSSDLTVCTARRQCRDTLMHDGQQRGTSLTASQRAQYKEQTAKIKGCASVTERRSRRCVVSVPDTHQIGRASCRERVCQYV